MDSYSDVAQTIADIILREEIKNEKKIYFARMGKPYVFTGLLEAPPFFIIFLLNALSGLRFNFKASLYCAVVSILVVFGLGFYDIYSGYLLSPGAVWQ